MRRLLLLITGLALLSASGMVFGQTPPATDKSKPGGTPGKSNELETLRDTRMKQTSKTENEGVQVRLKDIARFRGVRGNQLMGVGVVFGLGATGDTKKNDQAARAISNYLKSIGQDVDPSKIEPKNGALVVVTAELPPFSTNGQTIDVTVSSLGDATSLRGGTLLQTELHAIGDTASVYAIAQGAVSIGGFGASSGGNNSQTGFLTVGRVPSGAIVEKGALTKLVYDGKMFVELLEPDFTNASRVEDAINKLYPAMKATAENGQTISITVPPNASAITTMAKLEAVKVFQDSAALVVINEKTGSIAIGGNVKIGPVAIASGSISVRITEEVAVSQPNPFSQGTTQTVANQQVGAKESEADIAVVAPNTTVADLARIFQELRLRASDIINILQLLKQQGALKARLVIQ